MIIISKMLFDFIGRISSFSILVLHLLFASSLHYLPLMNLRNFYLGLIIGLLISFIALFHFLMLRSQILGFHMILPDSHFCLKGPY